MRSYMIRLKVIILLTTLLGGVSCSSWEPWIKPYDRENLSDPVMNTGRNPISASYQHHVYETREASRGAGSVTGGGCGCN